MVEAAEMLSRLDSMEPAAAAADAAEIRRIVSAAEAVAKRLSTVFAPDELAGFSARAAEASGRDLARQIGDAALRLTHGESSLGDASTVLSATVAFRPQIVALEALRTASSAARLAARTALNGQLTTVYNGPMSAHATAVSPATSEFRHRGAGTSAADSGAAGAPAPGVQPDSPTWQPRTSGDDGSSPPAGPAPTVREQPVAPGSPRGDGPSPLSSPSPTGGPSGPGGPSPNTPGSAPNAPSGPTPVGTPMPVGVAPSTAGSPRTVGASVPGTARTGTPGTGQVTSVRPTAPTSTATSTAGASATTAGAQQSGAGNPGARSTQMPYGAGPTARRSDDDGHRPADYLRSAAEGLLVLGPQPIVGPAVIGRLSTPEPGTDADAEEGSALGGDSGDEDDQELDLTL